MPRITSLVEVRSPPEGSRDPGKAWWVKTVVGVKVKTVAAGGGDQATAPRADAAKEPIILILARTWGG